MKHLNIIKFIFAAVALAAGGALADTWTDPDTGYTWTYYISQDESVIFNGAGKAAVSPKPTGSVLIPATLGDKSVKRIEQAAFYGCSEITDIVIPDGVVSVGAFVFNGCRSLKNVTIPDSVIAIDNATFYNCSDSLFDTNSICGVKLVDGWIIGRIGQPSGGLDLTGARGIGPSVFSGCDGLTNVTIPGSVVSIGESAFSGCSGLTNVTIGGGVNVIGNSAFSGCNCLTNVVMPNGVTSVGYRAFYGCSRLKSVVIPDSVFHIGVEAFSDCRESLFDTTSIPGAILVDGWVIGKTGSFVGGIDLVGVRGIADWAFRNSSVSVVMHEGIKGIGCEAFSWRYGPREVVIPSTVIYIGDGAFWSCEYLESVTIPESVMVIEREAFGNCKQLKNITVSPANGKYKSVAGLLLSKDGKVLLSVPGGLTSVSIPYGVKIIEERAFVGCSGLTRVAIPDGVTNIERWAFEGCSNLNEVSIPGSVRRIGYQAFYGCNRLFDTKMIPGLKLVDDWVVDFTEALSGEANLFGIRGIGAYAMSGCKLLTSVEIPEGIEIIPTAAFSGCTELSKVILPDGLKTIETYAFRDCNRITNLVIPSSIMNIARNAFTGCSCLKEAYVPKGTVSLQNVFPYNTRVVYYKPHPVVSFDSNGGPEMFEETVVTFGSQYLALPTPTWIEHVFLGWKYGNVYVRPDSIVTAVDDHTLVAQWEVNQYMVRFDANGGVGGLCEHHDFGMHIEAPLVTREGYSFVGWTPEVAATVPASNVTYTAQWRINQYAVAFDANGGGFIETALPRMEATQDYATEIVAPEVSREGYTFVGWSPEVDATVPASNVTYTAQWSVNQYPVTFDANGGVGGVTNKLDYASDIVAPEVTREGYTFVGWTPEVGETVPVGGATYTAQWRINRYTVTFDATGGTGGTSVTQDYGTAIVASTVTREGYTFVGWSPTVPATVPANDIIFVAQWEKNLPELHNDEEAVESPAPTDAASEYNGYLYDEDSGEVKGTIQVKVGKPGKKDGKASVKATVVIGTKKVTLKGADKGKAVLSADGPTEIELVGGEACAIVLSSEGISGYYGAYEIGGSRNFFASKDKAEANAANSVLSKWLGSFMVVWNGGSLSVSIAAKGKVKVSGTLADGKTKVSVNTVLLVGEEWSCVSVAAQKANLAFVLWLSHDGQTIEAEGLGEDVHVGLPGTLANGATFQIDADEFAAVFGQAMLPYLPDGVPVTQKGTKWTLPKAGKVAYKNGAVDGSKLGDNPCGLKLTYKAKEGTFKGSFKVYAEVKGKLKATTVNVTGFMLNGVGYGEATIKGKGSVPVEIK